MLFWGKSADLFEDSIIARVVYNGIYMQIAQRKDIIRHMQEK